MKLLIGILIVLALSITIAGCESGKTEKGRACWGVLGMDSITGEQCEPDSIDEPDGLATATTSSS